MRRDTTSDELIFYDDTIDGLLDFRDHADLLAPSLGYVHQTSDQYRLCVVMPKDTMPDITPDGPRLGEHLYDHISGIDLTPLVTAFDHFSLQGWIFTGYGWRAPIPVGASGTRIADHPDRERVLIANYLDQATGRVTSRTELLDGSVEHHFLDEPAEGWNPDNVGTIVATMQLLRDATR